VTQALISLVRGGGFADFLASFSFLKVFGDG
jgi:hypothetical protein